MSWGRRPSASLAGRRLALQRKFELNFDERAGEAIGLLTISAPGEDLLPWDTDECTIEGPHKCSGEVGCRVEWIYAHVWNSTAQARMSRLWEAATRSADRWIRRQWGGELPVQLANVRAMQKRGVAHWHYGTPQGSEIEREWSRHVRRFIEAAWRREVALGAEVRWAALELEWRTGEVTPGLYGFGFSHPGRGGAGGKVARYLSRNAACYLAANGVGSRAYVSSRLTQATGVTMRALRGCNWLYVRRSEGLTPWIPSWWSEDHAGRVLRVWCLLEAAHAP